MYQPTVKEIKPLHDCMKSYSIMASLKIIANPKQLTDAGYTMKSEIDSEHCTLYSLL